MLKTKKGRLLVCKAMLVSMATYNLRNPPIPPWFEKALKRGMAAFVWQREPQIDLDGRREAPHPGSRGGPHPP